MARNAMVRIKAMEVNPETKKMELPGPTMKALNDGKYEPQAGWRTVSFQVLPNGDVLLLLEKTDVETYRG